jgi:hypothetical protein
MLLYSYDNMHNIYRLQTCYKQISRSTITAQGTGKKIHKNDGRCLGSVSVVRNSKYITVFLVFASSTSLNI